MIQQQLELLPNILQELLVRYGFVIYIAILFALCIYFSYNKEEKKPMKKKSKYPDFEMDLGQP